MKQIRCCSPLIILLQGSALQLRYKMQNSALSFNHKKTKVMERNHESFKCALLTINHESPEFVKDFKYLSVLIAGCHIAPEHASGARRKLARLVGREGRREREKKGRRGKEEKEEGRKGR